jgi:hypothetical protein
MQLKLQVSLREVWMPEVEVFTAMILKPGSDHYPVSTQTATAE